jgi:Flp pilus assembly secretin CpaC
MTLWNIKYTLVALTVLCLSFSAQAEQKAAPVVDIIPAHSASGETAEGFSETDATHPALRVTPDKSEIISLDRDAASVIIGNPQHANIMADSVRKLVVIPRSPGATYFTVLDKDGEVIMQRHVIVASPKEGYMRVKRVCTKDSGEGCQNTSVFYCPDMCHEIGSQAEKDSSSDSGGMATALSGGKSDTMADTAEEGTSTE